MQLVKLPFQLAVRATFNNSMGIKQFLTHVQIVFYNVPTIIISVKIKKNIPRISLKFDYYVHGMRHVEYNNMQ